MAYTGATNMWEFKTFKTFAALKAFYERNQHRYQITVVYIENGYACEYCKLVKPRMPR